jgi:hypothetical protein
MEVVREEVANLAGHAVEVAGAAPAGVPPAGVGRVVEVRRQWPLGHRGRAPSRHPDRHRRTTAPSRHLDRRRRVMAPSHHRVLAHRQDHPLSRQERCQIGRSFGWIPRKQTHSLIRRRHEKEWLLIEHKFAVGTDVSGEEKQQDVKAHEQKADGPPTVPPGHPWKLFLPARPCVHPAG